MGSKRDCFKVIKKEVFGGEVNDKMLRDIVDQIMDIKNTAGENQAMFRQMAAEKFKEIKELNIIQKKQKLTNRLRMKSALDVAQAHDNKGEGILASLVASTKQVIGGQDSVATRQAAYANKYSQALFGAIEESPIKEAFVAGDLDYDISQAIWNLNKGNDVGKMDPHVLDIAKKVIGFNKMLFQDMRNAMIPVRYLDSFVSKLNHNKNKLLDTGFKDWADEVLAMGLDPKMFGPKAKTVEQQTEVLREIYEGIIKGRDRVLNDDSILDETIVIGKTANMGSDLAASRSLRFKDGSAFAAYNEKYGDGTLLNSLSKNMNRQARQVALIDKLGSNPEAGLQALIQRMKKRNAGDEKALSQIKSMENRINNQFKHLTGQTNIPGGTTKESIGFALRLQQSLAKLGNAGIRSISNFAVTAGLIRSKTGKTFMGSLASSMYEFGKGLSKKQKMENARTSGIFFSNLANKMRDTMGSALTSGERNSARASMVMNTYFKYNLLNVMSEGIGTSFSTVMQVEIGKVHSLPFEKLPANMQGSLLKAGIRPDDWVNMAKGVELLKDGSFLHSVDAMTGIEDIKVPAGISKVRYMADLETKVRAFYTRGTMLSGTMTGARQNAIIEQGTDISSWQGQIFRTLGQFKGFPMQIFEIMSELVHSNPDPKKLRELSMNFSGKPSYEIVAQTALAMTAIGYLADSLIRIARGDDIRNPADPKTMLAMLSLSGSAGMMGDFIMGEADNAYRSAAKDISGPTFGAAMDLRNVYAKAIRGEKVSKDMSRLIRNNLPLQNLPLISNGLDYIQYNLINETLNPGSQRKQERREKKRIREGETIANPIFGGN